MRSESACRNSDPARSTCISQDSSAWIRTRDLTIMRREQLLRSTAAYRSVGLCEPCRAVAAAVCCGLPLPQRFHMIAPAFARKGKRVQ